MSEQYQRQFVDLKPKKANKPNRSGSLNHESVPQLDSLQDLINSVESTPLQRNNTQGNQSSINPQSNGSRPAIRSEQSRYIQGRGNRYSKRTLSKRPHLERMINLQTNPQPQQQFQKQGDVIFHIGGVNIMNSGSQILEQKYQSFQQKSQLLDKLLENQKIQELLNNDPRLQNSHPVKLQSEKLPLRRVSSTTERLKSLSRSRSEKASPPRQTQQREPKQRNPQQLINPKKKQKVKQKQNLIIENIQKRNVLQISKNLNQQQILQMKLQKNLDLQSPLLVLTVLYIFLNFNEKINLALNLIIFVIVYFTMKKDRKKLPTKIELEISKNFVIEANNQPKFVTQEQLSNTNENISCSIQCYNSSDEGEMEITDEKDIIDRQVGSGSLQKGSGSMQNKMNILNQPMSRSMTRSNQGKIKKQLIREMLLKNITHGAMLCRITPSFNKRARKLSHTDDRLLSSQINVEEKVNINNSYSIFLGETSQNHQKLPDLNFNKSRQIDMEVIDMSDNFSKVFQVHYKISNIPCDQLETFQNSSQQLEDPIGSSFNNRPSNPTIPEASHASKNLYNSNHSLINSLSITSSLVGGRRFVSPYSILSGQQYSSSELMSKTGLTMLQQKMMELKIYMPYFISNETIIMYQSKSSAEVPQKLSVMDILEEHFLQKKTTTRLFFKVDLNEEMEKSQNAVLNLEDNNSSYSQNKILNNKTCKSKEMEEIAELNSNLEREKIFSIAEENDDKSLIVQLSKERVDSSHSSRSKMHRYKRKRCQTEDFDYIFQAKPNMGKRSSSQQLKHVKLEKLNDSVSSGSSEQMGSQYLNQSINYSGHTSKTSEYYENQQSGQHQHRTYSGNEDKVNYFEFEIKQIKDIMDFQDMKNLTFLNIKDVTTLVKNQKKFCDKTYQDAIENNYSHEQMTPLNPIQNLTPLVKQNIIGMYLEKMKKQRKESSINNTTIEGFEMNDLQRVIQNQKEAKQNLHNIISIEQSAKSIWFYNTNQIKRMKLKKNQIKVEVKPNTNIICTLWNVIWPFEHYVFKRRINIFLVKNLSQNQDMVADWNLYELVFYNILQNALKYNKNIDGDIVITMTCRKVRIQNQNQNSESHKFMLETQVIDSGVGIEPARQKLLFIPFQELKDRIGITNQSFGSIGLGLACSSDICKKVGGDITLKKSVPGLTVIAFKFPVTLRNKNVMSISGNESNGKVSVGRNSSVRLELPNSSTFINLKQDLHTQKKFEYIKLIGNSRPLQEQVKYYLMSKKLFPPTNLEQKVSLNNSRSFQSIQTGAGLFKELFSFPNQKIGFQLLENLEKQSITPKSLSGQNSVKSILSTFNISQINKKPPKSDKKQSAKTLSKQNDIINNVVLRQNSFNQMENKYLLNDEPSSLMSESEDFSVEEDYMNQQPNGSSPSPENVIRRSLSGFDVEEDKENYQMSMIMESADEQIDSYHSQLLDEQAEKDEYDRKQHLLLKREDDVIEEEEKIGPGQQHLKKLKIQPYKSNPLGRMMELIVEEDGPIEQQPSLYQIFSGIDLHNPNLDQRKLLFSHILNQGKCVKIIKKLMKAAPTPKIREKKPEIVQDILVDVNKEFIKEQGLRKYKKELKRQDIIYQLSESSSEEFGISSGSSSYGSDDDKIIPVQDQHVHQAEIQEQEHEQKRPEKLKWMSKVRSQRLQFEEAKSPLFGRTIKHQLSQGLNIQSQLQEIQSNELEDLQSVSIPENSVMRQIVIGSQIITLDNQIFDNYIEKHKEEQCDCEPKILIVEDTEFNMMTICGMVMKKFDIKPYEAQNGQIAIDMVRDALSKSCQCDNRAFKLIIMDINMPVKDGHQATKEILKLMKDKKLQQTLIKPVDKYCNIVALTSYTGDEIEKKCLDLNMKIVYNKPLNAIQLKECIYKYFFQSIENLQEFYQLRLMREQINQQMINS